MSNGNEFYTLESGLRIKFKPVPAFLIERVQARVQMPELPVFLDEETGRELNNPTDPDYLRAVQEAETRKIGVSMLAAVLFGVDLVDEDGNKIEAPSAEEDNWEAMLAYMGVDWKTALTNDVPMPPDADLSFARTACYLLYTKMTNNDIQYVAGKTLGGGEAYAAAVDTFPSGAPRSKARPVRANKRKQT